MKARLVSLLGVTLLLALLAATVATAGAPGVTTRVSVASDGTQGNRGSFSPAISADGHLIAFWSYASNLVPGDTNNVYDVFVRDLASGVTSRVSVASDGTQANDEAYGPAISTDGRYVAFDSYASNLVAGDTNGKDDIFVHDRQTHVTSRVSVASDGMQGNNDSSSPSLSADGRYVVFQSRASNLVAGDTNAGPDVFVHDRQTHVTTRVSVASDGSQADSGSYGSTISDDGRSVAFASAASNLVAGDTNGFTDVFVHDLQTHVTSRVSVASDGRQANSGSYVHAISADGRMVLFTSTASILLPGDSNGKTNVFVRDRTTNVTTLVSVALGGTQTNGDSRYPAISADGHYVAFNSLASNLVAGDTFGTSDVFVRDLEAGVTTRVSIASDGAPANGDPGSIYLSALSADGRYVAFDSDASNLVAGDTNGTFDVFVRDRCPAGDCAAFHRAHSQPDFEGNARADLLWRHAASGEDAVWLMNGPTPLSSSFTTSVADTTWQIVGVGDLDGDTRSDLVWRNTATGQNAVWFMNGAAVTGYAFLPSVPDQSWKLAAVADLNQDTHADLVWRNTGSGVNGVWFMNGSAVTSYPALPSVADLTWTLVGVGDLNGDEMADLVWRNSVTGQNVAWLMDGASVASYEWLPTVSDVSWTLAGVGDLNADYAADLLWRNTTTGQNAVWLMRAGNPVSYAFLPTVADQAWKLVAVSDLDGDHKADLVWRHFGTGQDIAWLMDGGTVTSYNWLTTVSDLHWRVVSPTSLMAALNGLLPGPTKMGEAGTDAAKPMWTTAPTDATPMWSAPGTDASK